MDVLTVLGNTIPKVNYSGICKKSGVVNSLNINATCVNLPSTTNTLCEGIFVLFIERHITRIK